MTQTYPGGCHCGAIRFEVDLDRGAEAQTCNCSMCGKIGFIHLIVPESAFRLTEGQDNLTLYTFNTGVAQHYFCATCGVKSFYRPRSNPDGWSVNLRCLDEPEAVQANITRFDGQNWEEGAAELAHLSQERPS